MTTRGFKEARGARSPANLIADVLDHPHDEADHRRGRATGCAPLTARFPVYR